MTAPITLGELIAFATDPNATGIITQWDSVAERNNLLSRNQGLTHFSIPDVDRLEAIAQAAWGEPLTVANLRRIRGRLVGEYDINPDDADAMPLVEVAEAFSSGRSRHIEQNVTLAHISALTGLSVKTFERAKNRRPSTMPKPKLPSIGGETSNRWSWSEIRPWLIAEGFGDETLPLRVPSAVFRKKR